MCVNRGSIVLVKTGAKQDLAPPLFSQVIAYILKSEHSKYDINTLLMLQFLFGSLVKP